METNKIDCIPDSLESDVDTALACFISEVLARGRQATQHPWFGASQRDLLEKTLDQLRSLFQLTDVGQPLSLMYLVFRAWGRRPDEQSKRVATAALMYFCGGGLLDDVQDQDLAGTPHEHVGPAIALNSGVTFMFLVIDALKDAIALEPDPERRQHYLESFNRCSLLGARSQHGDLLGTLAATTPEEVLGLHEGKACSIAWMMELGALLGGCDAALREIYVRAGYHLAGMVQIVDDLRDIYGGDASSDLREGKLTYPLAWFRATASDEQQRELAQLCQQLPASLQRIGELFYETGVIDRCADKLDELRIAFHREIASTGNLAAYHRTLLSVVDAMAETVFRPEPVPETRACFAEAGPFAEMLRDCAREFADNTSALELGPVPRLAAWHLPHFEYDPERRIVYHPDVDALADEVLPFHSALYKTSIENTRELLGQCAPLAVAHEMFHFLRDLTGRLTEDRWHEEYVANRLAVAYAQRFAPEALKQGLVVVATLLDAHESLKPAADDILARCQTAVEGRADYGVDPTTTSVVHARMVEDFASRTLHWEAELATFLGIGGTAAIAAE